MMEKIKKYLTKYLFLVVLVLSLPAIRSLLGHGFFGVSDDMHIAWLYEMDRVIKMLQFPPRFVPDLSFGFGYPLFNFVYPLPFYFGEIFHLIGLSLVDSVKVVFALSIPFSMYLMYRLLKEFLSEELSLAGAILYVYAPYRATEIFVRGTIGEIVAFVFLPLVAWSIIKLTKEKVNSRWIGISALAIAALVLSHNIMAYMFMPFAFVLLAARIIWLVKNKKAAIFRSLAGIILGLLVSIYFWWPAIAESRLMQYSTVFNFYDHFPTLKQLATPYFGYGASVPGPYDLMSFYIGIIGLAVVGLGTVVFAINWKKFTKDEKIFALWGILIFVTSVFMMNHRSSFLWRSLPLLPYFQFPWRFLAMVTFASPILLLGFSKIKHQEIIALVIIALAIVLNFNYFKPSEYLGRMDNYYLNRYVPVPIASDIYKTTSEEYLRLPLSTEKRPNMNYPIVYSNVDNVKSVNEVSPLRIKIETDYSTESYINYRKYYYPAWTAKIDNKTAPIEVGQPFGQIRLFIPSGTHQIEIFFKETTLRLLLDYVSLIGLLGSVFVIIKYR